MDSCKYHPLQASAFNCSECGLEYCGDCVDHSIGDEARCFHCSSNMEFHMNSDSVEPFWRRLEKAFRYPLNGNAMSMILGMAVFFSVIAAAPLPNFVILIAMAIATGNLIKYSFMCLTSTADGNMNAPNISEAFAGGLTVLFQLLFMLVIGWLVLYYIAAEINVLLAGVVMFILIICSPAIIISFAHTESVIESINPVTFITLISRIGIPYAVLILFIFIMFGSVSLISQIIGEDLSALSTILQSTVSNYYLVVMFHLMGYMLYQFQDKLGYIAGETREAAMAQQTADNVLLARIKINIKEGQFEKVKALYQQGIDDYKNDRRFLDQNFEFLYRIEDNIALVKFAEDYLVYLIYSAQNDRLMGAFKKIKQVSKTYFPKGADVRYQLAHASYQSGDAQTAVFLINGLHKQHPDYEKLVAAYELMHQALMDIPSMEAQAGQCLKLVKALVAAKSKRIVLQAEAEKKKQIEAEKEKQRAPKAIPRAEKTSEKPEEQDLEGGQFSSFKKEQPDEGSDLPPIEFDH